MKKRVKKIINWILIAVVIMVLGFFYAFVRNEEAVYGAGNDTVSYKEDSIIVKIECKDDMLCGMNLQFAPNNSTGKLTYVIKDSNGNNVTKEKSVKLKSLKKDEATLLKFDMIKNSADKDYTMVITCDGKADEVKVLQDSDIAYSYIKWDLETMVVFCFGALYLVGLAKVLMWMFRK